MINDVRELFDEHNDEFLKFDRVENKLHQRPDICAFLLLSQLVPEDGDIVSAAEHDEIFLETSIEKLERAATVNDIVTLIRCGVRYDSEYDCLAMFVSP